MAASAKQETVGILICTSAFGRLCEFDVVPVSRRWKISLDGTAAFGRLSPKAVPGQLRTLKEVVVDVRRYYLSFHRSGFVRAEENMELGPILRLKENLNVWLAIFAVSKSSFESLAKMGAHGWCI